MCDDGDGPDGDDELGGIDDGPTLLVERPIRLSPQLARSFDDRNPDMNMNARAVHGLASCKEIFHIQQLWHPAVPIGVTPVRTTCRCLLDT